MAITNFGTIGGETVHRAVLTSSAGVQVAILSYGAIVQDWRVPDAQGNMRAVVRGYDDPLAYAEDDRAFGIIAGRIANRVREGRFTLDGETYQLDINKPPHHIHGGREGLGKVHWTMEETAEGVRLTHVSVDGHMGYPGSVTFTAEFSLNGHALTFDLAGVPDRPTPVALAQHNYYHLGGTTDAHSLMVNADRSTASDADKVSTGEIVDVAGTAFDWRTPAAIGDRDVDRNFCLTDASPAATLTGTHFVLTISTDRPGLQVYNAYDMPQQSHPGHDGSVHGPRCAVALEAQDWPDAVNHANFPSVIVTPEAPYRQITTVEIVPT